MYNRIKARLSRWDSYDSDTLIVAVTGILVGLGSVFAGAPVVLGIGVGLFVDLLITALIGQIR